MTKFILVGGYPHKAEDGGKAFTQELLKDFDDPVKLLICYFARPRQQWDVNYVADKVFFANHSSLKIEYQLAKVDQFIEQLRWMNAMYIRGGDTQTLLEMLAQNPDWHKELEGKTVAGSSAGAMAIAKYWYSLDTLKLGEGLGLVPVKVQVHYRSDYNAPNVDWDKADAELKNYKEDLPILCLKEGQFEVRAV
jgi:peptidase E